jgi:hypothetical protein
VEDRIMTTNNPTVESIEALLRDVITAPTGAHLIIIPDASLAQLQAVSDAFIEASNLDVNNVDEEALMMAQMAAEMYSKDHITGEIVAGELIAYDDEALQKNLKSIRENPDWVNEGLALTIYLLNKIFAEVKQFRR